MRVNIYAEEISDRIEIVSKEIEGRTFTGLRFYLELPVTLFKCRQCGNLRREGVDKDYGNFCSCPRSSYEPVQVSGPFMHHPDDDDSSAVTFWGKRDLREVLKKALVELDRHYSDKRLDGTPWAGNPCHVLELSEEDRQLVLLALAVLSLESPGFDHALNEIAKRIDNVEAGRAQMYDRFREMRVPAHPWVRRSRSSALGLSIGEALSMELGDYANDTIERLGIDVKQWAEELRARIAVAAATNKEKEAP